VSVPFPLGARAAMFASPVLAKLVAMLRKRAQLPLVLRILYNLAVEERGRASLAKTEVPMYVRKQVRGVCGTRTTLVPRKKTYDAQGGGGGGATQHTAPRWQRRRSPCTCASR